MLIGKTGQVKTAICKADRTSIMVRGYDLCEELMGKISGKLLRKHTQLLGAEIQLICKYTEAI